MPKKTKNIAIIGAGISGLVLAHKLSGKANVTIFEKAKGVGGRMTTRYDGPFFFDHGAQCFTARLPEFRAFLKPYIELGIVAQWQGEVVNLEIGKKETKRLWFEPHLVASPNMNSLCKELAKGVEVRLHCEVVPLANKVGNAWELYDKDGKALGHFDLIISTAPPEQTIRLFAPYIKETNPLLSLGMQSCYAVMLGFNKPWDKKWIAAKVKNNPIKWISVNSSKPGRDTKSTCLVLHSRNNWAKAHIDDDINEVQAFLLQQFQYVTGIAIKDVDYISTHRWRYSIVEQTKKSGFYINQELGLAATSDWCQTSRIEEVWFWANALADFIAKPL